MHITSNPVTTDEEVEAMRLIRNAGRKWMTHNQGEISPEKQREWWRHARTLSTDDFSAFIYRADKAIVGYGLLVRMEQAKSTLWVSLAVAPDHQGRGYGTCIYEDLKIRCPDEPIYAEVYHGNVASLSAALKAGYKKIDENEKHYILRSR